MAEVVYPIAKQGIFLTVQGEGTYSGTPMVFVRFAGCDVNCPMCDTDYTVQYRLSARQIVDLVKGTKPKSVEWLFLTGGEPTMYDLAPLLQLVKKELGMRIMIATAGERKLDFLHQLEVDWLYVSPHNPKKWVQHTGGDLNIVPYLNRFNIEDFLKVELDNPWLKFPFRFSQCWVTPCEGKPETVKQCVDFVVSNPRWKLNCQSHKLWNIA